MQFKVQGHSDSTLHIETCNNVSLVVKESSDFRLLDSIKKQSEFKSNYFKTPPIHDVCIDKSVLYKMDYVNGYSFFEFLNLCSKNDLDFLISKLNGYFNETIKDTEKIEINTFADKMRKIGFLDNYNYIFDGLDYIKVFTGKCHGDMTLSNMIFKNNDIYLIDFLDSYLESPTLDLVKLRQDTHLYWSFNMIDMKKSDILKSKIALKYIDDWIVGEYDIQNYKTLQTINLLRILPYATDTRIKTFIYSNIKMLWQN